MLYQYYIIYIIIINDILITIILLIECPNGCTTCTVDYADGDKTKCTGGGCTVWDTKKAYTDGETGTCERKYINISLLFEPRFSA